MSLDDEMRDPIAQDAEQPIQGEIVVPAPWRTEELPADLPEELAAELATLIDDARAYAEASEAPNTSRAYSSDWRQFAGGCDRYRFQSLPAPAPVVALYVTWLAKRGYAVSTIRRRAAA